MVSGTDKRGPQLCRYREDEVGSRRGKKKNCPFARPLELRVPRRYIPVKQRPCFES